jgi:hypothetical protein
MGTQGGAQGDRLVTDQLLHRTGGQWAFFTPHSTAPEWEFTYEAPARASARPAPIVAAAMASPLAAAWPSAHVVRGGHDPAVATKPSTDAAKTDALRTDTRAQTGATVPFGYGHMPHRLFHQAASGSTALTIEAPAHWQDISDATQLRLRDPATGTELALSMRENPGVALDQWAQLRMNHVKQTQAHLPCVRLPTSLDAALGPGLVCDFRGRFTPSSDTPPDTPSAAHATTGTRVMMLRQWSVVTPQHVFSLDLTATDAVLAEHQTYYRWLLGERVQWGAVK